jgi:uncharacterized membrane protein YbjE (DUF340 family)
VTLFVVVCVCSGLAAGFLSHVFIPFLDDAILAVLVILVFGVGLDIGARGDAWTKVRSLGPKLLAIPVLSALGSLTGVALTASLVWGHTPRHALALGSAFGWYSLSGPLLTRLASPEIGAIAFLSDATRELTAFLFIPLVARRIGFSEAVALGGATSMDTTLPLISQSTGGEAAPLAFVHGMVLGLVVPILLPFWFSL